MNASDIRLSRRTDRSCTCGFARCCATIIAYQMLAVGVGWQVYSLTGARSISVSSGSCNSCVARARSSSSDHVADRFDRPAHPFAHCQLSRSSLAVTLWLGSAMGWITEHGSSRSVFVVGCSRRVRDADHAGAVDGIGPLRLLPGRSLPPRHATQTAIILGPAAGGFLYVAGPSGPTGLCRRIPDGGHAGHHDRYERRPPPTTPTTLASVFAGLSFIRRRPAVLGAITLDMVAVLLGGAAALLPIYAKEVLETGPWGLGILRSAPAVGALGMALYLARHPLQRHAGRTMFIAIALFGLATIGFGLSRWLPLSLLLPCDAGRGRHDQTSSSGCR
jgi:hypothetical protein